VQVSTLLEIYILSVAFLSLSRGFSWHKLHLLRYYIIYPLLRNSIPYPVLFFLCNLFDCTSFFFRVDSSTSTLAYLFSSILISSLTVAVTVAIIYRRTTWLLTRSHACHGCLLNNGCYAIGFDMSARLAYPLFFFFLSSHVKGDFFLTGRRSMVFGAWVFFCSCRKLR